MTEPRIENIIIKNFYFEHVNTPTFEGLIKKNAFDAVKPRHWLNNVFCSVEREVRYYFEAEKDFVRLIIICIEQIIGIARKETNELVSSSPFMENNLIINNFNNKPYMC